MVLGHYCAVLVGTWWYWASITWICLESINQSIFISGLYTYMLLDMLLLDLSEQSVDSQRQVYFHDTQISYWYRLM